MLHPATQPPARTEISIAEKLRQHEKRLAELKLQQQQQQPPDQQPTQKPATPKLEARPQEPSARPADSNSKAHVFHVPDEQTQDAITVQRQSAVRAAMKHAWDGYKAHAWGHDELNSVSNTPSDWMGMGLSIVDSLDTLFIMGLKDEFAEAREWVANSLDLSVPRSVSFFECTIRVLGGLIAAYEFSGDKMFLEKAQKVGDGLVRAFNSPTGIPYSTINLISGDASLPGWTGGSAILAEAGTVQLEFRALSRHTQNPSYAQRAERAMDVLDAHAPSDGLLPIYVNPSSGALSGKVTLGAMGDSFFEYLIKLWWQSDKKEEKWRRMYDRSAKGIIEKMVGHSGDRIYLAELEGGMQRPQMDHLACFAAGMFMLGSLDVSDEATLQTQQRIAKGITATCHEGYHMQKSGLGPEIMSFYANGMGVAASHYILRPETVEAYFYMWRLTHDPIYREWGWEAFEAIEKHCRTPSGYSGVRQVNVVPVLKDDRQQSFFMAETLKYLYLLFSGDSVVPLDQFVFNTEAHPLRIFRE
eukprot:TRINITY_DN3437_c0_g1_i2.p1 TRINITY_DN3437_c0_g1~~TRINITY_DN3437_c0_g1_i2.p1  ORF type:complete len:620 (-),score=132.66 TRINITY_DN3437_c0_g1_i2:17-1600(-)